VKAMKTERGLFDKEIEKKVGTCCVRVRVRVCACECVLVSECVFVSVHVCVRACMRVDACMSLHTGVRQLPLSFVPSCSVCGCAWSRASEQSMRCCVGRQRAAPDQGCCAFPHTQIVRSQVQGALVRMERDNNSVYYKRVPTLMPPMAEVVAQGASVFCVRWGLGKTPQSSKRFQGLPALKARGGGEE